MIESATETFLRACATAGVDFSRTMMLGRQQMTDGSYAEGFFETLGASKVDSLDASDFEAASIVADLNRPLPPELRRRYSAVIDGGTLEHVFDVATALRSTLDLVELGGHYVAASPANNWAGHGFYQFSPELFFRSLSAESGFDIRGIFVVEQRHPERWYAISDPKASGSRLYWRNRFRTSLVALAQRVELVELSQFVPQQSDYAARWVSADSAGPEAKVRVGPRGTVKKAMWRATPKPVRDLYEEAKRSRLEQLDPARFKRISADGLARLLAAPAGQNSRQFRE